VDTIRTWSEKTEVALRNLLGWAELHSSTFNNWTRSYGRAYEHNAKVPRDHWLTDGEKQAIIRFYHEHPLNGYRRLTYMMLDADVVACSPSTVHRVLSSEGLLSRFGKKTSQKGNGFDQPKEAHQHWHIDVSHLNICGAFYFCASILDGYSRMIVHWDIRPEMKEIDIEAIVQRAKELYPDSRPRIISDNGPQFIAKDFKSFVRLSGMTHVRTSPYYPQSNGKLERYHRSLKHECIRQKTPLNLDDAKRVTSEFVHTYNEQRLHSALGYITPRDMLEGRQQAIHAERDRKLEAARERRAAERARTRTASYAMSTRSEDRATLGSDPSAESMPKASALGAMATHHASIAPHLPLATMR
jgi:transposase InsO family protein